MELVKHFIENAVTKHKQHTLNDYHAYYKLCHDNIT